MALVLTRGIVRALSVFDFDFEPVQLRFACSCSCLEYVLGMCCDTCEPVPYQQLTYAVCHAQTPRGPSFSACAAYSLRCQLNVHVICRIGFPVRTSAISSSSERYDDASSASSVRSCTVTLQRAVPYNENKSNKQRAAPSSARPCLEHRRPHSQQCHRLRPAYRATQISHHFNFRARVPVRVHSIVWYCSQGSTSRIAKQRTRVHVKSHTHLLGPRH